MSQVYTEAFYDAIRGGVRRSAEAVVAQFLDFHYRWDPPTAVLDVGCGEGWWAREFRERTGCRVRGVDSGPHCGAALEPGEYVDTDLADAETKAELADDEFDVAVCLEVAEHLPPPAAEPLIDSLVAAAPVVLFSAAVPDQPGLNHVNCRWQNEWAEEFGRRGYLTSSAIRWRLWDDTRVEWWYRQNLFVAWQPGHLNHEPEPVYAVIHPEFWAVR